MRDGELELDFDRFEYDKIETFGGDSYFLKVGCHHRNREDVESVVTGRIVAVLCLDCGDQLPAGMPE